MEFFRNIRMVSVPLWLKTLLLLFLFVLLGVNIYVGAQGLLVTEKKDWVEAAADLLGVLLPIFLIAVLMAFTASGVAALQAKTEEILVKLVPTALRQIGSASPLSSSHFYDPTEKDRPKLSRLNPSLHISHRKGNCWSEYRLRIPSLTSDQDQQDAAIRREVYIQLQINVKKMNFLLYILRDTARRLLADHGEGAVDDGDFIASASKEVFEIFKHTVAGAVREGYTCNETLIPVNLEGRQYLGIVLTKQLSDDFLYNSAEKLHFVQDLVFMIDAFISERIDLFEFSRPD